ncbi:CGNR zinc finger domain-containing protein [Saccharothrix algeriensis]|uniref:ABATE domain-containing protein n=1 Tax=Saccharothrix algeriensis TaxID=173560 RepID=A0A8T8I458_9PSEU|nr:ABATE domain-containing protein [Saccharothrix algeriensis]MBM7810708.1 putative RNA-binding Zn ribbon-like protein [Saccharothrix algeriensis]QTR04774.1 ABATE domain-containing protein [Saccharothrix algeriensis]
MNRALEFASTVRHDGRGGLADDLATTAGLAAWAHLDAADEELRLEVVRLRWAVRSLFAHAVGAGERMDSPHLVPLADAVRAVNDAAARAPRAARLEWGPPPLLRYADSATEGDRLLADLATAAIAFLAGEERADLRACPAPRCIRYFVKAHPQQQWCKPSCGNRARVSKHYHRTRA